MKRFSHNNIRAIKLRRPLGKSLQQEQRCVDRAIGRKIRELRDGARTSRQELARILGTTTKVLSRVENGSYEGSSLAMLRRITVAFNLDVKLSIKSR